jgi:hypothetical protein
MSTREESLTRLHAVVDDHPDLLSRAWAARGVKEKLDTFSDETIQRLEALLKDEILGAAAIKRTFALLETSQVKNLESVVRNIIIFAEAEKHYTDKLGIRTNKPWKVFSHIEKYAHTRVCGVHNAVETTAQAKQMIAVFHAVIALVQSFSTENDLSYFDSYAVRYVMANEVNNGKASDMIEVFQKNPTESARLFDFVTTRGTVDPKLLEAVLFFGDDLPSAVFSGVL